MNTPSAACTHYVPHADPALSAWQHGEPAENGPAATRRSPLKQRSAPTPAVPCDFCGERPWQFIVRVSTTNNKLVREARYCHLCAKEKGVLS